ncbi:MAG: hypothetical protein A2283_21430 [Lentisphaerae bacterium RIFOXYA12_FULL_48_11]|nr:MAG: hypothetical protein A2283_21430 [Lentisphaerae bacterium RIFOXYA12_FULL_48_11]
MSNTKQLVNLDAMILRSDFATQAAAPQTYDMVPSISLRDFTDGALVGPNLRKPDFQRETNHWTPQQVLSLLQCFVNGDLIPSVILWKSPTNIFVIDGGHRLSVLRAWVEDDYGDGPVSLMFFDRNIPAIQKKVADKTRKLINETIGSFKHVQATLAQPGPDNEDKRKFNAVISRALSIQWVNGNADKAESAFFKINTEGTPLDDIEELLLKARHKPISIAARAIIRAGTGHKYWSAYALEVSAVIEEKARIIHQLVFEPDLNTPVKTLDLPLGGAKGVRVALRTLLDFVLIACRNQQGLPKTVLDQSDDTDGSGTTEALKQIWELASRITGNDQGSLGLHPAVYFYGPSGQHQAPMFMGTALLLKGKLLNNDPRFFQKFAGCRARLEKTLVEYKSTIAAILQGYVSRHRVEKYANFLEALINRLESVESVTNEEIVTLSGLTGKVLVGSAPVNTQSFSDEVKSETFIRKALENTVKCAICGGYLDPAKSVSYDHIIRRREGGNGAVDNCDLTHPYCNQSVKN